MIASTEISQEVERSVYNAARRVYYVYRPRFESMDDIVNSNWLFFLENKERLLGSCLERGKVGAYLYWAFVYNALRCFRSRVRLVNIGDNAGRVAASDYARDFALFERQKNAVLEYAKRPHKQGTGSAKTKTEVYIKLTLESKSTSEIGKICGVPTDNVGSALRCFIKGARVYFAKNPIKGV